MEVPERRYLHMRDLTETPVTLESEDEIIEYPRHEIDIHDAFYTFLKFRRRRTQAQCRFLTMLRNIKDNQNKIAKAAANPRNPSLLYQKNGVIDFDDLVRELAKHLQVGTREYRGLLKEAYLVLLRRLADILANGYAIEIPYIGVMWSDGSWAEENRPIKGLVNRMAMVYTGRFLRDYMFITDALKYCIATGKKPQEVLDGEVKKIRTYKQYRRYCRRSGKSFFEAACSPSPDIDPFG